MKKLMIKGMHGMLYTTEAADMNTLSHGNLEFEYLKTNGIG